jgi:hypothetical protein
MLILNSNFIIFIGFILGTFIVEFLIHRFFYFRFIQRINILFYIFQFFFLPHKELIINPPLYFIFSDFFSWNFLSIMIIIIQ